MLAGKKIILGVTGSIAAYKSVLLLRLLIKEGAEVKVVITKEAEQFVSALTFSTLSREPVLTDFFENDQWKNHALLGRWADMMIIVPATANTIAKMANGFCDNLLQAIYLSASCPVIVAPAMDEDMWNHAATKKNIKILEEIGATFLTVGQGDLASGLTGYGRLMEPEKIFEKINTFFREGDLMKGKKVLISAGPTIEPIDPVRFISNHSSGKMGIALARAFIREGAGVTLVAGPIKEAVPGPAKLISVKTAEEMYNACLKDFNTYDIIIMAAAVADYTPEKVSRQKIKKTGEAFNLNLKPTKDILLEMGRRKNENQLLIGFALESENGRKNALEKLRKKNADFIILNSLNDEGAGFGGDTNKISIFGKNNNEFHSVLKSKDEIASDIVHFLSQQQ